MSSTDSVSPHDVIVCACGAQEYTARDAIDAAIFRGELEDKWQKFLHHIAAEGRADELELELDESAISAAAEEFRYRHDLITAEETEAWLANRGLTFEHFSDYFGRQYCVSAIDEGFSPEQIEYTSATPEMRDLFVTELILSEALEDMITKLMWRLAARCAGNEPPPEAIAAGERKFLHRIEIEPTQLAHWLEQLGRDSLWLNETVAMEAAYEARCDKLLVPETRQRELIASRLALTQFEVEIIELESRDAAKEALFCVREDGMPMEEVAIDGRYPYRRVDFLLEEVPIEAQRRLLGVSSGQVLDPLARNDGFELWRITKKIEPQPDDPGVKSRIDQRVHNRHFSELLSKYVRREPGASGPAE